MHRHPQRSAWELFLPITFAVASGILVAVGVLVALLAIVASHREREAVAHATAITREVARSVERAALPAYPAPASSDPVGSLGCSGGVVFRRLENGWQQASRGNAPACVTSSR